MSTPPVSPASYTAHAGVLGVLGLIFLFIGWPFLQGVTHPAANPYGATWQTGDRAGQPVAYFDLEYGAAWRDAGAFATAAVLIAEAVVYGVMAVRPGVARPLLGGVIGLGVIGAIANGVAAAMQAKAGFGLPLLAVIGLAACVFTAYVAAAGRPVTHTAGQ